MKKPLFSKEQLDSGDCNISLRTTEPFKKVHIYIVIQIKPCILQILSLKLYNLHRLQHWLLDLKILRLLLLFPYLKNLMQQLERSKPSASILKLHTNINTNISTKLTAVACHRVFHNSNPSENESSFFLNFLAIVLNFFERNFFETFRHKKPLDLYSIYTFPTTRIWRSSRPPCSTPSC